MRAPLHNLDSCWILLLLALASCATPKEEGEAGDVVVASIDGAATEASSALGTGGVVPASGAISTGIVDLFDGKTLGGWNWQPQARGSRAPAPFEVAAGGVLVHKGWPLGVLRHAGSFGDFVLELDYMTPTTTKNPATGGVMVRVSGDDFWPRGLEINLDNGTAGDLWVFQGFPIEHDRFRTRGTVLQRTNKGTERRRGEWNQLAVRVEGDRITVTLNGQEVNSAGGLDRAAGEIALRAEGAEFQFRGLRVTPIE